ncbi:MAG: molybdate ABC transporter substrate-binding protein, partial [Saprospiraceae bacterium]
MRHITFVLSLILFGLSACQNEKVATDPDKKLVVAVAANAQFAMEALKEAFEKSSDARVELVVGSSGKLTAQLLQGAPYDIFVSADMKYPDTLFRAGIAAEAPTTYAYGTLVIWTCKDINLTSGVRVVVSNNVQKIAIANPRTAPYGEETMRVLSNLRVYDSNVA